MTELNNIDEKIVYAKELFDQGWKCVDTNLPEEAVRCLREAMILFDECGEYRAYTRCINLLGITYANLGNESMAVDCYLDGLEYARLYRVKGLSHVFYNNIGTRYHELEDWNKALEYFIKAKEDIESVEVAVEDQGRGWLLVTYLNLGLVYFHLGQLELAEEYFLLAREQEELVNHHDYAFSIAVMICRLQYLHGNLEYVTENLPTLLNYTKKCEFTLGDYTQDIKEFIQMLEQIQDYENWEKVLRNNDEIVKERGVISFIVNAQGFWTQYYQAVGNKEAYRESCIRYARLYKEAKTFDEQEKSAALNLKIDLQRTEKEIRLAEKKSERDVLTGLGNRYALHKHGQKLLAYNPDQKSLLAVGMFDLDHFKRINDTYGHMQGDTALKQVADILFDCFDGYGEVYRYGGDEYVAVIPQCTPAIINKLAGKVRRRVDEAHILNENSDVSDYLTLSQGYYVRYLVGDLDLDEMIDKADTVLYEVKKHGKNGFKVEIRE